MLAPHLFGNTLHASEERERERKRDREREKERERERESEKTKRVLKVFSYLVLFDIELKF